MDLGPPTQDKNPTNSLPGTPPDFVLRGPSTVPPSQASNSLLKLKSDQTAMRVIFSWFRRIV